MNYYNPNFYANYPYSNGNTQFTNPYQQASMQPSPQMNGKFVENVDMVRVAEVPIGGYGIFPKADLSEIYVKSWNTNGTTNIFTFTPFSPPESKEQSNEADVENNAVLERITSLEEKIDAVLGKIKPEPARKEFNL